MTTELDRAQQAMDEAGVALYKATTSFNQYFDGFGPQSAGTKATCDEQVADLEAWKTRQAARDCEKKG